MTVTIRPATRADSRAQCDLFARVDMRTDIDLSVMRDPDFDALYRMQSPIWESWVAELDGDIEGMATILVRNGYVAGTPRRIGYLGDLRLSPRVEGRHILSRFYGPVLESAARRLDCDIFLTTIIESNTRAVRALTSDNRRTSRRPRYVPLRRFAIRAVHLTIPRFQFRYLRHHSAITVRTATDSDLGSLSDFLDADGRSRPFGYPCDLQDLQRKLDTWPHLETHSFYLAEDAEGKLVGCVAAWDTAAVKRMVVNAYRGPMRRTKLLYNAAAKMGMFPCLPSPGERFRYVYLTHQAVPSEDPAIMRALLGAVYHDYRGKGYHFLSCCVYDDDPLAPAYRGFQYSDLYASLYMVAPASVALQAACFDAGRPGFEMALV